MVGCAISRMTSIRSFITLMSIVSFSMFCSRGADCVEANAMYVGVYLER